MSVLPLSRVGEREEVANFARHVPNLALKPPDHRAKSRRLSRGNERPPQCPRRNSNKRHRGGAVTACSPDTCIPRIASAEAMSDRPARPTKRKARRSPHQPRSTRPWRIW